MPKLYDIDVDFSPIDPIYKPNHFFLSAWSGRDTYDATTKWRYNPDEDFPSQCYMHRDVLSTSAIRSADTKYISKPNSFWIELRKIVERENQGDVFYTYRNQDYHWWWNKDATQYNKEKTLIRHGYWTFYFESQEDQTMFMLRYKEYLSKKKYRFHPSYGVSCIDDRYDVPEDEHLADIYGYTS